MGEVEALVLWHEKTSGVEPPTLQIIQARRNVIEANSEYARNACATTPIGRVEHNWTKSSSIGEVRAVASTHSDRSTHGPQ